MARRSSAFVDGDLWFRSGDVFRSRHGRAGMALGTMTAASRFDPRGLYAQLARELPAHAMPLFVRMGDGATTLTDTYKLGTAELVRQGYASSLVTDLMWLMDEAAECCTPMTPEALVRAGLKPHAPSDPTGAA